MGIIDSDNDGYVMAPGQRDELLRQLLDRISELEFAVDRLSADLRWLITAHNEFTKMYATRLRHEAKHGQSEFQK